eukprot:3825325-Rhodomonas_salina.1
MHLFSPCGHVRMSELVLTWGMVLPALPRAQVVIPSCLRACYATSGTDILYGGTRLRVSIGSQQVSAYASGMRCSVLISRMGLGNDMLLLARMPSTDSGRAAMQCPVLTSRMVLWRLLYCTISGTDVACDASGLGPRYAMSGIDIACAVSSIQSTNSNHAGLRQVSPYALPMRCPVLP